MKPIIKLTRQPMGLFSSRGVTLVELLIASVIMSVAFLTIISSFGYITKSLVQTRYKAQVTNFAKAEIDDFEKTARVYGNIQNQFMGWDDLLTARSLMKPLGKLTPAGIEYEIVSYPRKFSATESYQGDQKYSLKRTAAIVSTLGTGSYESKVLRVTLADSKTPPRFSPITIETRLKKPDISALDKRSSTDFGYITGTVTDTNNAALGGVIVTLKQGNSQINTCTTAADGAYAFSNVLVPGPYTIVCTKTDYWTETSASFNIGAGANPRDPVLMQPVYKCTVEVHITKFEGGGNVGTALVLIAAIPLNSDFSNAGLTSELTQRGVDANTGIATYKIPIPIKGVNVTAYSQKVQVTSVKANDSALVDFTPNMKFDITKDGSIHLDITLYPVYYAKLNIYTYDADTAGIPALGHCWLYVYDTFDAPLNTGTSNTPDARNNKRTDHNGRLQNFMVRTNTPGDINNVTRKTRNLNIMVKKVGYQVKYANHTIDCNNSTLIANIGLNKHKLTHSITFPAPLSLQYKNLLDLNIGLNITQGGIQSFNYLFYYVGHCGTITPLSGSKPGVIGSEITDYKEYQQAVVSDPSLGYALAVLPSFDSTQSSASIINRFYASSANTGAVNIGHKVYIKYTYKAANLYGDEESDTPVELEDTIPSRMNVVLPGSGSDVYAVSITETDQNYNNFSNPHPTIIFPTKTEYFRAGVTLNGTTINETQNLVTYTWSIGGTAQGTTSSQNGKNIAITAGGASNLGLTITARVDVNVNGQYAGSAETTLTINYTPLTCYYLPANDNIQLAPFTGTRVYTAYPSGGFSPYKYYWSLIDEYDSSNLNFGATTLTPSSSDPALATKATYVAGLSGKYRIVLKVIDSNNSTVEYKTSVILNKSEGVETP
jgi:hypothetical protein